MSAGIVNALDNIDYALFVSNCPGLECVSRVRAVTDTRVPVPYGYQLGTWYPYDTRQRGLMGPQIGNCISTRGF